MPANQACVTEMSKMMKPEEAEITENTKSDIWGAILRTKWQMRICKSTNTLCIVFPTNWNSS